MQEISENYRFSVASSLKLRQKAIDLHHKRYQEVGFFHNNEVDPYENDSVYFIVQAIGDDEVVGVTRLIFKELSNLPTMAHFEIFDIEYANLSQLKPYQYAEISAFTKMPQHDVGMGLIKTAIQYSLQSGISHWICCIDERVFKYLQRVLKFPFDVIGIPQVYLGSVSIPCSFDISEGLKSLAEYRKPLHEYFMDGMELTTLKEVVK